MPYIQNDQLGAFVTYQEVPVPHAEDGPLSGLTLAVKDIFDVAGYPTGCGNPTKTAQAQPALHSATGVQAMLDAGAEFVGKTLTDELATSLTGDNVHYGSPVNVRAPGRIPGGSSCGSAAAVGGGLADIATGSDTGGSVRAPASYCGLFGLRPSWGRIPLDHTMPLADSFDTFGWFTRDIETFRKVGNVLMGHDEEPGEPLEHLLLATDAFDMLMGAAEHSALAPALAQIEQVLGAAEPVIVAEDRLESWYWTYRHIQCWEAWQAHGEWIEASNPQLGPGVIERFHFGRDLDKDIFISAMAHRKDILSRMAALLGDNRVLVLPTVPSIAPLKDAEHQSLEDFRNRALSILCISVLSGLPQITLPLAQMDGCPLGMSLIAPAGRDRDLIALAEKIVRAG